MPNKKILVLAGVLVALAAASWFVDRAKKTSDVDARVGQLLLDAAASTQVDGIHIKKAAQEVLLAKDAQSRWQLTAPETFPASAEKVVQFFESLTKAKIVRLVEAKPADLVPYDISAEQLAKLTRGTDTVLEVQFGKMRSGGGQYVRFAGEEKVYLTDQSLFLESAPAAWELRTLANVKAEDVKEITFKAQDQKAKSARLFREKPEDTFKLEGAADADKLNTAQINQLSGILANVNFTARHKKDTPEFAAVFAKADEAGVATFGGTAYQIQVGSKTEPPAKGSKDKPKTRWFLALRATPAGTAGEEEAALLNGLMDQWTFEVEEFVANRFRKSRKDFLENNKG